MTGTASAAPASNPNALTPQNIMTNAALNSVARNELLASALRQSLALSPDVGGVGGQTFRHKLENLGILTAVDVLVSMTVTNNAASGGAALAPTPGFPYNLIKKFALRDYANLERIQASGLQIFLRNAIHNARVPYTANTYAEGNPATPFAYPSSSADGAIPAASSATIEFYIRVPISVGMMNTVGALLMQANTGQVFFETTFASNSAAGGFDQPFVGDYSISNIECTLVQQYLQPQGPSPVLPYQDLSTVYELNGLQQDNTNLAVGLPKFINFPDARIVHGMYLLFANGAWNYGTDLTSLKVRMSGNTYVDNDPPQLWIMRLREMLGGDIMPGFYYYSSARKPIVTNLLGQVQLELIPSSLGANPYTLTMSESTYAVNTPLPGIGG